MIARRPTSLPIALRNKTPSIVFLRNKHSKLRQLFNVAVLSAVIKLGDSGGRHGALVKVQRDGDLLRLMM